MARRLYLCLVFLLMHLSLCFGWILPLKLAVPILDFAASKNGEFFPGLLLETSAEAEVRSMREGTIVFERRNDAERVRVPWGRRASVFVDHPGAYRVRYAGLVESVHKPVSTRNVGLQQVSEGQVLGRLAENSENSGILLLQIYDLRRSLLVNPQLVLDIPDQFRRTVIQNLSVKWDEESPLQVLPFRSTASTVNPVFHVDVVEYVLDAAGKRLYAGLPWRLQASLNGTRFFAMERLVLAKQSGQLVLLKDKKINFNQLFTNTASIDLGSVNLVPGLNVLEIGVLDRDGKGGSAVYRLTLP